MDLNCHYTASVCVCVCAHTQDVCNERERTACKWCQLRVNARLCAAFRLSVCASMRMRLCPEVKRQNGWNHAHTWTQQKTHTTTLLWIGILCVCMCVYCAQCGIADPTHTNTHRHTCRMRCVPLSRADWPQRGLIFNDALAWWHIHANLYSWYGFDGIFSGCSIRTVSCRCSSPTAQWVQPIVKNAMCTALVRLNVRSTVRTIWICR